MISQKDWREMVAAWRNVCILGAIFVILSIIGFFVLAGLLGFAVHSKDELREILREVREIPDECLDPCPDNCADPCQPCPDPCPSPCPPPVNISEIIGLPSDTCDDKDPCTIDRFRNGSCIYERLENGCACTSDCFVPVGTGICWEGICTGAPCKGFCEMDADCPNLNFTNGGADVNCVDGSCLYTIGPDINGAVPCTESCLFLESCKAMISNEEPLKHCLKIDVFCAQNGDITCNYFFECAVPLVL